MTSQHEASTNSPAPQFDAASEDWVMVNASAFVLEPLGAQFEPEVPGQLLVRFGDVADRHRGVEVSALPDGWASVQIPGGAKVYWLPGATSQDVNLPWENRLRELDHERGVLR